MLYSLRLKSVLGRKLEKELLRRFLHEDLVSNDSTPFCPRLSIVFRSFLKRDPMSRRWLLWIQVEKRRVKLENR